MQNWNKINNIVEIFKKGGKPKIKIKPENVNSFTKYCNGKVTEECIRRGKNSPDPKIRKKATFAANSRKWKHQWGGQVKPLFGTEERPWEYTGWQQNNVEEPVVEDTYAPTLTDLTNFTKSFETFSPTPYILKTSDGKDQVLAGYGSANPEIIELARQGKLTEEIAAKEVERKLQEQLDLWSKNVPNFKNLPLEVQFALADTSYNGKDVLGTIKGSPSLMKMINAGVTDPEQLTTQMDHSKNAGGWLGVRSAARRAMALGKYDWNWEQKDKYGRQIDSTKYKGPQDWKSSPYFGVYRKGGILWN